CRHGDADLLLKLHLAFPKQHSPMLFHRSPNIGEHSPMVFACSSSLAEHSSVKGMCSSMLEQ
ncbi:MAG: hypothetical protein ACOYMG_25375, partial [Candidatus Methylumidiphilus sp.]